MQHVLLRIADTICILLGYDEMGYELSKPKLRSELESDLKRYIHHYITFTTIIIPYLYIVRVFNLDFEILIF